MELRYVKYLWDDKTADGLSGLDRLVYRSNKLGEDLTLTNTGGGNNDFFSPPALRYWIVRLNLGF